LNKKILGAAAILILMAFSTIPAFAATDTTVTGTVLSVDTTAGTFQIGTENGDTLTVTPPAGFDLTTLTVGDTVAIQGTLEASSLSATSIAPVAEDGTGDGDGDGRNNGSHCTNPDSSQPALDKLSSEFNADYVQLLDWFCTGGYGVGEIMLALRTSQSMEGLSAQEILELKTELNGWGKVWQQLGLIGHGHGQDDNEVESELEVENEHGPAAQAGQHSGQGNGHANEHSNGHGGGPGSNQGHGGGNGHGGGHGH